MILFISIGFVDPKTNLFLMAVFIIGIGFSSATQDAMIDTFRIESTPLSIQSAMSGTYIIGYRLGMIATGAVSLMLASWFGGDNQIYNVSAWQKTYMIMAIFQSIGLLCCLMSPEPISKRNLITDIKDRLRLINVFFISLLGFILMYNFFPEMKGTDPLVKGGFTFIKFTFSFSIIFVLFFLSVKFQFVQKSNLISTFWDPINNFIRKYGSMVLIILLIIGFYRVADVVIGGC